jgi:hypothetical protein
MATQGVSESAVASTFLKELGAPDTDLMRKAVTAWLRKESGSKVIGNNPWNISLAAANGLGIEPTGYRTHSRTGQKFAVYGSITDGTRAAARLLLRGNNPKDTRGYAGVIAGARSGNPIAFLNGLAGSKWSADKYGGVGNNSLLRVYQSITGFRNITQPGSAKSQPPDQREGDLIKFPEGHILTAHDVNTIIDALDKAGKFKIVNGVPVLSTYAEMEAKEQTRQLLLKYVGQPWGKELQDTLFGAFGEAADKAASDLDPLGVGGIISNIGDPGFWGRILALIGGVALVGFGVIRLAKA